MPRQIKYYEPEQRRYFEDNLQCMYCGNTNGFFIDLRLRHLIKLSSIGSLIISIDPMIADRVSKGLARNVMTLLEKAANLDKPVIRCANCGNYEAIDNQYQLLEYCWQMGCPGCGVCGEYISLEDLKELCFECIRKHDGQLTDDECGYVCVHYDWGLEQVRAHYNVTLEDFKRELGY